MNDMKRTSDCCPSCCVTPPAPCTADCSLQRTPARKRAAPAPAAQPPSIGYVNLNEGTFHTLAQLAATERNGDLIASGEIVEVCPVVRGVALAAAERAAIQPAGEAARPTAEKAGGLLIGVGDPMAFFADFCERSGYPSDGDMDAALRGAFYEGIRYCAVHTPAAPEAHSEAGELPPLPPFPVGDRFKDEKLFRSLGGGSGHVLYECWDDAITAYALAYGQLCRDTAPSSVTSAPSDFQSRVQPWMTACFGHIISNDLVERNHRFLEEALELVQSTGCTKDEAIQLVDYVYGRPLGQVEQEVGGVMVTLAALCLAQGIDMHDCGEVELVRIWSKVEQIRAKQAAKPKHSPLPAAPTASTPPAPAQGAQVGAVTDWPEEPTPEMQQAGAGAIRFDTTIVNKIWTANAVYRAMRAAFLAKRAEKGDA